MKIGIFGGSFDPPHMGHVWVCRNAIAELKLDKLFIVPNFVSPLKNGKAVNREHILNMTQLLSYEPGCYLDTREIYREVPSFTADTVQNFRIEYPHDKLYLIMGGDSTMTFKKWKNYKTILRVIDVFGIVPRMGDLNSYSYAMGNPIGKMFFLKPSFVQISSTQLRQMIHRGEDIEGLIPIAIQAYILRHKLYL
jgi:nicotinate-nucleotide adenylyltransferase